MTNKPRSFKSSQVIETGLSDHHKMTITVLKAFFQKQAPIRIRYRDYKRFDKSLFHTELCKKFRSMDYITYEIFEDIFMNLLNMHAPMREKYVRANNAPFVSQRP